MTKFAIIVAGGSGTRMNSAVPKQFLLLKDKPVLCHSIQRFLDSYQDMQVILVLPEQHLETGRTMMDLFFPGKDIRLTTGGATRFDSVKNGLALVSGDAVVFVHDGVRCLVSTSLIHRCYESAVEFGSAIPVVPAKDSIRLVTADGNVPLNRNMVKLVQTPQVFLSRILLPAFSVAYEERFTDEATVVEASGLAVHLVEGDERNIKITTPADLETALGLLDS